MAPTAAMLFFCYQSWKPFNSSAPRHHAHSISAASSSFFRFSVSPNGSAASFFLRRSPEDAGGGGRVEQPGKMGGVEDLSKQFPRGPS